MDIKICGITRVEDALTAAQLGVNFVGLILAPSPRQVTSALAAEVARALPDTTHAVLVFRDAPLRQVTTAVKETGCRWIQLHGCESPDYVSQLVSRVPDARLIKTWEITNTSQAGRINTYLKDLGLRNVQPAVLLLALHKGRPHPGYACFARVARRIGRPPAVWLAGGLTPENVSLALNSSLFNGVDVASGVESHPGVKDKAALELFIQRAREPAAKPQSDPPRVDRSRKSKSGGAGRKPNSVP